MSVTYIVPWRDIVGEADMEEFCNISRALYWMYQNHDVPNPEERVYKSLKNDHAVERYIRLRGIMRKCGYELVDDTDVGRWRGWLNVYLDGEEIKFSTNAPPDRVYINMAEFLEYRDICNIEDKTVDVTSLVKKLAGKMKMKYAGKRAA